ncbi:hypothetical protein [Kitasatospora viridis]|uniref:Uncharacterized protein n=1 Tax=Kitasatospora viridis TaxID=281105 RepID=A0A561UKS1_9ACTN|nr:hypothetical protein [Kitasatospora viridis]TWF99945.1 hypothetical protein FHX73_113805 [Kitasatospora viridis]
MAQPLTDEQLTAIAARAEGATPGPWTPDEDESVWRLHGTHPRIPGMKWQILKAAKQGTPYAEYWPNPADAEFIAAARADVPALLAEVHRLRAERDGARTQVAAAQAYADELTTSAISPRIAAYIAGGLRARLDLAADPTTT